MAAKGTKVSEQEKQKMVVLFEAGLTFKEIGRKLHRNPDTVSRYVHANEVATAAVNLLK